VLAGRSIGVGMRHIFWIVDAFVPSCYTLVPWLYFLVCATRIHVLNGQAQWNITDGIKKFTVRVPLPSCFGLEVFSPTFSGL
jgi:hypothetical protein